MRIPPTAFGFDNEGAPNAGAGMPARASAIDKSLAMLLWVYLHTNLRFAGGYVSMKTAERTWHSVFEPLWLMGWGLALFDNTEPTSSSTPRSEAQGNARASDVAIRVGRILPNLARPVVYIDNEDHIRANNNINNMIPYYIGY